MSEIKEDELVEFEGRNVYPEVAEYFRLRRQAERDLAEARADAEYPYRKVERAAQARWEDAGGSNRGLGYWDPARQRRVDPELAAAHDAFRAASEAYDLAYREAIDASRQALRASSHPEVQWIEANALRHEQGYSEIVLRNLPVQDPLELWELKRKHGMCGEFDRLFRQAEAEGVFSNGKRQPGSRELFAAQNWIRRNWGDRYASQVIEHMQPYIKAVREHYETEMAAAKAEWQGLDEAWRSERSRRGAATRAARAAQAAQEVSEELAATSEVPESKADTFVRESEETRTTISNGHLAYTVIS